LVGFKSQFSKKNSARKIRGRGPVFGRTDRQTHTNTPSHTHTHEQTPLKECLPCRHRST